MALVNGGFLHYMNMKKFLKNLLVRNCWSDFEIISQECSLGDPFQKLFAKFWSAQKHGSDELGLLALYRDMKKFLKNLQNCWSDFEIISQECYFGDLFKNCSRNFDPSINMALVNGGFLYYRDMKKFLKNLLLGKCWLDFEIISWEYSLGDSFQKVFAKFWSLHKHGSGEWGDFSHYRDMKKFLKNLLLRNCPSDFEIISQDCSLGDPFQNRLQNFDLFINMALVNGDFLHYMDMKKFLRNFVLQNRLSDFEIISQECSFGDPFQKLFTKFWSVYKNGSGEWGLFALYRHEFLHVCIVQTNLVLRNHWSDFEIISQESGFDISRRPSCAIRAIIATGKLPWPFVSPPGK